MCTCSLFTGCKQKQTLPTISSSDPALVATQKTERPETQRAEIPRNTLRRYSKTPDKDTQRDRGKCIYSPATSGPDQAITQEKLREEENCDHVSIMCAGELDLWCQIVSSDVALMWILFLLFCCNFPRCLSFLHCSPRGSLSPVT